MRSSLHDFEIRGAAEVPTCGTHGGFRAVRRRDGLSVILHRFRPPAELHHGQAFQPSGGVPSFDTPFVSRFTDSLEAAGSAYLVEPLPISVPAAEAWQAILTTSPECGQGFAEVLVEQVSTALSHLARDGECHAAVCLENLVLTQQGVYGLLAGHFDTTSGRRWVRPDPRCPPRAVEYDQPLLLDDVVGLGRVVHELLVIEARLSQGRCQGLLAASVRSAIMRLSTDLTQIEPVPGHRDAFTTRAFRPDDGLFGKELGHERER